MAMAMSASNPPLICRAQPGLGAWLKLRTCYARDGSVMCNLIMTFTSPGRRRLSHKHQKTDTCRSQRQATAVEIRNHSREIRIRAQCNRLCESRIERNVIKTL